MNNFSEEDGLCKTGRLAPSRYSLTNDAAGQDARFQLVCSVHDTPASWAYYVGSSGVGVITERGRVDTGRLAPLRYIQQR